MNKNLILFAHPRFEKSKTNRALLENVSRIDGVTVNDLYERYPDFNIDTDYEKKLLLAHQIVIWHHPFYMYSVRALLKQWIDLVLEYGWAHGRGGDNLENKIIFNVITSGGTREVYAANARILVAAIDSPEIKFDPAAKTKKIFPNLTVMVRARSRLDAHELFDMGINDRAWDRDLFEEKNK